MSRDHRTWMLALHWTLLFCQKPLLSEKCPHIAQLLPNFYQTSTITPYQGKVWAILWEFASVLVQYDHCCCETELWQLWRTKTLSMVFMILQETWVKRRPQPRSIVACPNTRRAPKLFWYYGSGVDTFYRLRAPRNRAKSRKFRTISFQMKYTQYNQSISK